MDRELVIKGLNLRAPVINYQLNSMHLIGGDSRGEIASWEEFHYLSGERNLIGGKGITQPRLAHGEGVAAWCVRSPRSMEVFVRSNSRQLELSPSLPQLS